METPEQSKRFTLGPVLFHDDFADASLRDWVPEREKGGTVAARQGKLVIDVPGGCTVWYRPEMSGPILIEYDAVAVQAGGPNDRVSDLNCFWMAQDPSRPDHLLDIPRSGKFADYDTLTTYYVGLGGNSNTTTRFRRYIGKPGDRPLLPQNDLKAAEYLLKPGVRQRIQLVACEGLIQYYRDGRLLFELNDPAPYTRGWFGLRTTASHLEIERFRVYRLRPEGGSKVRIFLVGDSTVAPQQGWGPGFAKRLTGGAECINRAMNGRSSRSFIGEGLWQKVLAELRSGDYVLIQFGHNDQPGKGPERETDPKTTYPEYLGRYIDESRAKGAKPILVTSLTRRRFGPDHKIASDLTEYVDAAKKEAAEKHVPLLDLHASSIALLDRMTPEQIAAVEAKRADGTADHTHLSPTGSEVFGGLVADELPKLVPELAPYIHPVVDQGMPREFTPSGRNASAAL